jgi:hypothetical protein
MQQSSVSTLEGENRVKLTTLEKGYIAGILDSEGTICCRSHRFEERGRSYFDLTVTISNTNLLFLENIQSIVGGHIVLNPPSKNPRCRRSYYLRFYQNDIVPVLSQVFPLLIVKKEQTKLALSWFNIFPNGSLPPQQNELRTAIVDLKEKFYWKMKSLNMKGKNRQQSGTGTAVPIQNENSSTQSSLISEMV